MSNKEVLENLIKVHPEAEARMKEIIALPEEEVEDAISRFQEDYKIILNTEEIEESTLGEETLEKVAGGNDFTDWFGVFTGLWGLFPPSTGRGTISGTKRFR